MKKRNFDIGGLLPPQDIELEEAVLGGLMLEKDAYERVSDILKPEVFYKESHGLIYKAIVGLIEAKENVDILTVASKLRKDGNLEEAGGAYFLTQLTNRVASAANIETHAHFLAEKYLSREVIRLSMDFQSRSYKDEEDVFDMIDELYLGIESLKNFGSGEASVPFSTMLKERVELKSKLAKEGVHFTGIPTGNETLDKTIGGFVKKNLYIFAARPAMGKSVKALEYAKNCAKYGEAAAVFSLEMSAEQLTDRYLVSQSNILASDYRDNNLTPYDLEILENSRKELSRLPIHIYDTPAINLSFIKKKANLIKKNGQKLGMIVIDYIQLMTGNTQVKGGNREQEIAGISRGLKTLAMELDCSVIALAQLSREVERSSDKRPNLSHLRESGSIEQDADAVMFLYRPSYYFEQKDNPNEEYSNNSMTEEEYKRVAEIIIGKNRNGVAGVVVREKFYGEYSKFIQPKEEVEIKDVFGTFEEEKIDEVPF